MHYSEGKSYVYIMRFEDGILKVGHAIDVADRRSEMKNANEDLDIMKVWRSDYWYCRFVEMAAHKILRPYLAYGNEFYRTSLRRAADAVKQAFEDCRDSYDYCVIESMKITGNRKNIIGHIKLKGR